MTTRIVKVGLKTITTTSDGGVTCTEVRYATPRHLQVLLHYYYRYENMFDFDAEASELYKAGMLDPGESKTYRCWELSHHGRAWVRALLMTPPPTEPPPFKKKEQ